MKMKKYINTATLTQQQIEILKRAGISLEGRTVAQPKEVKEIREDGIYIRINGRTYKLNQTKWINVQKVTEKIKKQQQQK